MYDVDMVAVLSIPRINLAYGPVIDRKQACTAAGVTALYQTTGLCWDDAMNISLQKALNANPEYILVFDWDAVFTADDVRTLRGMIESGMVDAIAAKLPGDYSVRRMGMDTYITNTEFTYAHLSFTILRTSSLRRTPKPWLTGNDVVWFWRQWAKAINNLWITDAVRVGFLNADLHTWFRRIR